MVDFAVWKFSRLGYLPRFGGLTASGVTVRMTQRETAGSKHLRANHFDTIGIRTWPLGQLGLMKQGACQLNQGTRLKLWVNHLFRRFLTDFGEGRVARRRGRAPRAVFCPCVAPEQ